MKRKTYIGISLSKRTQKGLSRAIMEWKNLPVKWTKPENLHLEILSLGFIDDDGSFEVCKKIEELSKKEEMFDIELEKITLFPSQDDAKKIVLIGKHCEELKNVLEKIEKSLGIFISPRRFFYPQIVLGRIRKKEWDKLLEKPVLEKESPLLINAEHLDIVANNFESEEGEYALIESCPLN